MYAHLTRKRVGLFILVAMVVLSMAFATVALARPRAAAVTPSTSTVTVTAKSVTGAMVKDATVTLFSDNVKFRGTTGADGKVVFTEVPAGSYYVSLSHRLFVTSYYKLDVNAAEISYVAIAHPISLWEGIGY